MNLSIASGAQGLIGITNLFNSAVLTIYDNTGSMPASPETAITTQLELVTFTFANPAFATFTNAGGYDVQAASFVSSSVAPDRGGTASFARVTFASAAWQATHAYTRGAIVTSSSNYYVCLAAGTSSSTAPTATTQGFTDGTVVWAYLGPTSAGNAIADLTVGTSTQDVVIGNTTVQTGTNVTISSFKFQTVAP